MIVVSELLITAFNCHEMALQQQQKVIFLKWSIERLKYCIFESLKCFKD